MVMMVVELLLLLLLMVLIRLGRITLEREGGKETLLHERFIKKTRTT